MENAIQTLENQAVSEYLADFVIEVQRSVILRLVETLNMSNVSFPQFFLLAYLASEEYLTMKDIAKKMGHSKSATTGLVDHMKVSGLVERIHSDKDRRKIMVRITAWWVKFLAKMRLRIKEELETLLQDWKSEANQTIS